MSIQKANFTTSIQILKEERGLRPIHPFSSKFIVKYVRGIGSQSLNERRVFKWKAQQLVSKYLEKKEAYTQLIIFIHDRLNLVNYHILVWKTSIRMESSTTCIQILGEERGICPIHHLSLIYFRKDFEEFFIKRKKYLMLNKWEKFDFYLEIFWFWCRKNWF